ncbi:MucR family transcriptional regulator [Sphingomonas sp. LY160]|uniref:MucR family transcriptional regulator n=1 Tax=Sphingomonas sp. LY160 TaxID=3095342 RepID=UPI002ADEF51B|nr:MucR family transcriptional regulator [Sphingomonas sp. LY160]MEA1072980.1 MucR family transcriptional regulator [Sphingomonas sp. LY160]
MDIDEVPNNFIDLTADIVAAHVTNNSVAISDVATLISNVHSALAGLSSNMTTIEERKEPAVSIRQSVKPDYLVCLEDGKKMKMLRRYLMTNYGMTPEEYRTKWNLPKDYPMTAPSYAERRRDLAKSIGLGTKTRKTSKGNKPK